MKFGYRKPSFKKSFKARTTTRYKKSFKSAFIPYYGRKGAGWFKNPKKAAYNKIYKQTTRSIFEPSKNNRRKRHQDEDPRVERFVFWGSTIILMFIVACVTNTFTPLRATIYTVIFLYLLKKVIF